VGALGLLAPPATPAQTAAALTFTKDVAPIFQNKCESCHRPDSIADVAPELRRGEAVGTLDS
jgi:hypothetical protein